MQSCFRYNILILLSFLITVGTCCDEQLRKTAEVQFEKCIKRTETELLLIQDLKSTESSYSPGYCRKLQEYQDCTLFLAMCEVDFLRHQENKLLRDIAMKSDGKKLWDFCQTIKQNEDSLKANRIAKRSAVAKKRGRSGGNSRPSSKSRSRIPSSVRSTFTGGRRGKGQKVLRTLFGRKKGKLGNVGQIANKGVKRKGGFLRKAGKYAVVGLAAYGTYKLAKKMVKGLRGRYDDDDCWEYSYFRDQYSCNCNQCDDYRGSSSSLSARFTLILLSISIQTLLLFSFS